MDAPGVGLEAPQAGEHQDGEEESQHGEAQRGVRDQGQGLQIPLQLLLTERSNTEIKDTIKYIGALSAYSLDMQMTKTAYDSCKHTKIAFSTKQPKIYKLSGPTGHEISENTGRCVTFYIKESKRLYKNVFLYFSLCKSMNKNKRK